MAPKKGEAPRLKWKQKREEEFAPKRNRKRSQKLKQKLKQKQKLKLKQKQEPEQENKGRNAFGALNGKFVNGEGEEWANQLPASQLDLMISIKRLAVERMSSLGDHSVVGLFTWKSLQCLEIILEEFMKEQLSSSCPSVMSRLEDSK